MPPLRGNGGTALLQREEEIAARQNVIADTKAPVLWRNSLRTGCDAEIVTCHAAKGRREG